MAGPEKAYLLTEKGDKFECLFNPSELTITKSNTWKVPEKMPVSVYLRLRVRDLAGNESLAVTPEPQLVDLNEPEGRLLNVSVPQRKP